MDEYSKGARCADLAAKYKTPIPTLTAWMRKAGLKFRPIGADARKTVNDEEIVRQYLAGEGVLNLAVAFQVSRPVILRRLQEAGITLRTASQQAFISNSKLSPEERSRRTASTHAAIRGRKTPKSILRELALGRQHRGRMTNKESAWREKFFVHGIATVPQYAVGHFSVDLAIPHLRIAIEICSGWSATGRKKEADVRKKAALEKEGWIMIMLYGRKWSDAFAERVQAYIASRQSLGWPI